jgi:hypothetical protein
MLFSFADISNWLSDKPRHTKGVRVLQVLIGLMICFRIGTEVPFAKYLWGPNGIATGETSAHYFGVALGGLIDALFYTTDGGIYFLLFILFTGAVCLVINVKTRFAVFVCAFCFIILELRLPAINDGGDNITRLTLIYMLLLTSNPLKESINSLKIWLHNIGIACIISQLMILYWTSGFMKIMGDKWQNGTAMYLISNVEWFSLPWSKEIFKDPYITTISTYLPMVFMILFPIAIFSRFKFTWIIMGIIFHLSIGYFMGLVTFSMVMIGLELFLITDDEYRLFRSRLVKSSGYKSFSAKLAMTLSRIKINNNLDG